MVKPIKREIEPMAIRDGDNTEDIIKLAKKKKFHVFYGNDPRLIVAKVPFGIPSFDNILGGGLPLGRTTLIVGNFGAG